MTNESPQSSFPQTRQDLSNLKTTAVEAASDISRVAADHAKKAQGHFQDLATHAQVEGGEQLDQAKVKLADLGNQVRALVTARPLAALGTALTVGFLIGFSRRGAARN